MYGYICRGGAWTRASDALHDENEDLRDRFKARAARYQMTCCAANLRKNAETAFELLKNVEIGEASREQVVQRAQGCGHVSVRINDARRAQGCHVNACLRDSNVAKTSCVRGLGFNAWRAQGCEHVSVRIHAPRAQGCHVNACLKLKRCKDILCARSGIQWAARSRM